MLLSRVRAWFDDATVDVPAEDYFFGFNSPGPNCSSSILGAAHRSLQTVGYGIAFSDYHLLRFLTESDYTQSRTCPDVDSLVVRVAVRLVGENMI
jgi:hypothetical protein